MMNTHTTAPAESLPANPTTRGHRRRALLAGISGYVLEWFDFGVYGFLAPIIAKNFFPAANDHVALLASFAVFGVGFVARPVGSLVLGRMGDTRGRQKALSVTMLLMAGSTVLIGCLPSFAQVGFWAPVLLVLARLIQGFSAGGEWGTAAAFLVEWGGRNRRGFFGAFQQSSIAAGLLLGSAVAAIITSVLSADDLTSWGWRIPFFLGALLGPLGMYIRRKVPESPAYAKVKTEAPLLQEKTRGFSKSVFHAFSFVIFWAVSSYMVSVYMPTFAAKYGHITRQQALWTSTASLATVLLLAPLMGAASDKFGRKPLLLTSCVFFLLFSYPLYGFIVSGITFTTFFWTQWIMNVVFAMYSGAGPSALAEMFPTRVRSTGVSFGGALAMILGGFSPFLTTWVIEGTGEAANAGWILSISALATLPALILMKEGAKRELA
jgi:MHS family proline/betaine transporter-like MFS transporter